MTMALRDALAEAAVSSRSGSGEARFPIAERSSGARPKSARRRGWLAAALAATALVLGAAGAVVAGWGGPGPSPGPSSPTPTGVPRLIRGGIQVTASSTAPASKDAAGNVITYLPKNVVDGDVQTAWRAPGDGRGVTVTLLFDNPVYIRRIGLIPGYAKTDPQTGADRFREDRIISRASYLVPGLPPITRRFRPQPYPQFVDVNATAPRVSIRILSTTAPGGLNYTAISEVYVYGFPAR
jgi:hypothetical protein